jgi:hypothetical protein
MSASTFFDFSIGNSFETFCDDNGLTRSSSDQSLWTSICNDWHARNRDKFTPLVNHRNAKYGEHGDTYSRSIEYQQQREGRIRRN